MTIRVGINGFGRVGRMFTRGTLDRDDIEVVAVNDVTDAKTLAHLLAFDSTFGRLGRDVKASQDAIVVDGKPIAATHSANLAKLDWGKYGADIVVESTGLFSPARTRRPT